MGQLLEQIDSPNDLRKLQEHQLPLLCKELREEIVDVVSHRPGHLGASLGAIELTVALHYVFNTPYDKIVWDVGHQAYAHKLLTGRKKGFKKLRAWDGISGFPTPAESEYDCFAAGHASNSISAALGMAVAAKVNNEDDKQIVAVIGDGAMSGGLAFEGLNNASSFPNNLIIILNDNNMSIDKNVGGFNHYLVDILTSKTYNSFRYDLYRALKKVHLVSEDKRKNLIRVNNSLKALLTKTNNIFEGFSIRYFGPIDGNDVHRVIEVLNNVKDLKGPKIIHLCTVKGKGYKPAENGDPTIWHAPGRFDKESGERDKGDTTKESAPKFQDVFGHTLVELADQDKRIVGVTPAMPTGCSMTFMMKKYPNRAYDVGIAESHAVTFSAGLSKEGLIPFCNVYSSFMQRGYDQIIHDVALSNLHVIICLDRAGLVGEDGPTHHGVYDLAYLKPIPNLTIASPYDEHQLRNLMLTGYKGFNGPFVIRYPRGKGHLINWQNTPQIIPIGKGECLQEGEDLAFISIGPIGHIAANVCQRLKEKGYNAAHYNMIFLKPMDEELLTEIGKKFNKIITIEDGAISGGMGESIVSYLSAESFHPKIKNIGVPDEFIRQGTVAEEYIYCKMDEESVFQEALKLLNDN